MKPELMAEEGIVWGRHGKKLGQVSRGDIGPNYGEADCSSFSKGSENKIALTETSEEEQFVVTVSTVIRFHHVQITKVTLMLKFMPKEMNGRGDGYTLCSSS
ncbi:unnamed protein product [Mesocestoides corti]|uniref:Uncharacterized protein n=1 Tax=Mesocestoides corti TaxID=53468 RepID=A0A0R3UGW9_MESCO|nr:unnamed protein product [Mesocestoides corti]